MSETSQPLSEEQEIRLRLQSVDALVLAAERRDEVMGAVAGARNPDEACRSVADLLGISENAAAAVLGARLRGFSQSEIATIRAQSDELRNRLDRAP